MPSVIIRTHDEALTAAAMRVSNPDRSPARIVETQPSTRTGRWMIHAAL
jgi:hypothetical protein